MKQRGRHPPRAAQKKLSAHFSRTWRLCLASRRRGHRWRSSGLKFGSRDACQRRRQS